ncbi:MAG: hypothetical protein AB1429_08755 [Pseudomonadota bacterium]|jgi:hypothetical protein
MAMRVVIAGILGGVLMFIWTAVAHVATPLGTIGVSSVKDEAALSAALPVATGAKAGFYIFPAVDQKAAHRDTEMARYIAKAKVSGTALLVYHPPGADADMSPKTLASEFAMEVVEALLCAWILSLTTGLSYFGRLGVCGLVGLVGGLTTNASYLIWYGFPCDYTLAYIFIDVVRFLAAGVGIAWLIRGRD